MSENKEYLDIEQHSVGDERRMELWADIFQGCSFLPSTITLQDIDEDFKRWVEQDLKISSDDGKEFPTVVLFSNQRFSEYTQSWSQTDENQNMLLNFKTITRDNNPQYGKIQNGYWNIPGDNHFFTMTKKIVMDDNGTESLWVLKMRQPTALDLVFKLTILTTQYHCINDFNIKVNKLFRGRQCYIRPQNHYMPMILDNISDESQYQIDDRQFYAQSYSIKVMSYIITEDDYRVEQIPLKRGISLPDMSKMANSPEAEIIECDGEHNLKINVDFNEKCNKPIIRFTNDTDFQVNGIELTNVLNNYKFFVNDIPILREECPTIYSGDTIKIIINKIHRDKAAKFTILGTKLSK